MPNVLQNLKNDQILHGWRCKENLGIFSSLIFKQPLLEQKMFIKLHSFLSFSVEQLHSSAALSSRGPRGERGNICLKRSQCDNPVIRLSLREKPHVKDFNCALQSNFQFVKRRRVSGWGGGGGRKISQRENHPEHVEQHTDRQMVDAAKKATILPIIRWPWQWQLNCLCL